jgi:hypothetical protein
MRLAANDILDLDDEPLVGLRWLPEAPSTPEEPE